MSKASSAGRHPRDDGRLHDLLASERFDRREMLPPLLGATILFLLGSLGHYLPGIGLSAFDPIALSAFALLAVAGGLVALAMTLGGRLGQALLMGLLAYLVAELHVPMADPLAVAPLGVALGLWKPRTLARLLGVIFAVVLVGSLFAARVEPHDNPPPGASGDPALPPLLHVIVDEIGPEPVLPPARFSQWTGAHSRYHVTKASLPDMTDRFYAILLERGYDLEIWRSDYVRSCPDGARCARHRNFHAAAIRDTGLPLARQVEILLYGWLRTGQTLENVVAQIDPMIGASHVSTLTSLDVLQRVDERAATLGPGEALSVHVLLPHYPYALAPDCTLKPFAQWVGRSPAFPVDDRRTAYADQLACLAERLADIGHDDMVIVVHGDHGTRYFDMKMTDSERREVVMHQAFATQFALHLPGAAPRTVDRPASVGSLLEELAASDFTSLPVGREQSVFTGEGPFREVER